MNASLAKVSEVVQENQQSKIPEDEIERMKNRMHKNLFKEQIRIKLKQLLYLDHGQLDDKVTRTKEGNLVTYKFSIPKIEQYISETLNTLD